MKKPILLALGIFALALTCQTSFAQEGEHQAKKQPPQKTESKAEHGHGHSHSTKVPETVEGIWKAILAKQGQLERRVAAKKLGEAHDYAFAIRDLVDALPAKVPAENKSKAEAGAKEIAKLAADIDKSSAAKAQKATEANVTRMGKAITALQTDLHQSQTQ